MRPPTAALRLYKATIDDGPFLLAIRNLDDVRSQSKTKDVIDEETHRKWLHVHLGSPESVIWIIEMEREKLGYVRAQQSKKESSSGEWLLSIALKPFFRGQGLGTWAVHEACRLLHENFRAECVVAEVLCWNAAALNLFKPCGFRMTAIVQQDGQDMQRLELALSGRL